MENDREIHQLADRGVVVTEVTLFSRSFFREEPSLRVVSLDQSE